ncbi:MAG: hypothetical protein ACMXYA_03090 [Candidatus Woesearchaeota archaeon]
MTEPLVKSHIEFLARDTKPEELANTFKEQILRIQKPFFMHENNEEFIRLRPLYATALRNMFLEDNPTTDEIYEKLTQLDIGIEKQYFVDLYAPRKISYLHQLFFVDYQNPFLANYYDGRSFTSYTETNAPFSPFAIRGLQKKAQNPSYIDPIEKVIIESLQDLVSSEYTWIDDFEMRIPILYGFPFQNTEKSTSSNRPDYSLE